MLRLPENLGKGGKEGELIESNEGHVLVWVWWQQTAQDIQLSPLLLSH